MLVNSTDRFEDCLGFLRALYLQFDDDFLEAWVDLRGTVNAPPIEVPPHARLQRVDLYDVRGAVSNEDHLFAEG